LRVDGTEVTNAISIAAGSQHAVVLLADGTVLGIGNNSMGQSVAGDGKVLGWLAVSNGGPYQFKSTFAQNSPGVVMLKGKRLDGVRQIAAAHHHNLALKDDGRVVGWGTDFRLEPFTPPANLEGVQAVACGQDGDWFLKDGQVLEWRLQQLHSIMGLSNVTAIAGSTHNRSRCVALQKDGLLAASSTLTGTQILSGAHKDIRAIAAGWQVLALHSDGRVSGFGGQTPKNLTNVAAVAVGYLYSMAARHDGTLALWGGQVPRPLNVPEGLSNVIAIALADHVGLAITTNAAVANRFRR
ncbi:MAG TPA: hypothetical protein VN673_04310, partial [Clostridia bacterium]|nr:hypothetical protein [Clostridia bacterium]